MSKTDETKASTPVPSHIAQAVVELLLGESSAIQDCPYSISVTPAPPSNRFSTLHLWRDAERHGSIKFEKVAMSNRNQNGVRYRYCVGRDLFTPKAAEEITNQYGQIAAMRMIEDVA